MCRRYRDIWRVFKGTFSWLGVFVSDFPALMNSIKLCKALSSAMLLRFFIKRAWSTLLFLVLSFYGRHVLRVPVHAWFERTWMAGSVRGCVYPCMWDFPPSNHKTQFECGFLASCMERWARGAQISDRALQGLSYFNSMQRCACTHSFVCLEPGIVLNVVPALLLLCIL